MALPLNLPESQGRYGSDKQAASCHIGNKNTGLFWRNCGERLLSVTYVTPFTLYILGTPPIVAAEISIDLHFSFPTLSDRLIKEGVRMEKTEGAQNFDPLRTWREWYQKSEKQWSDTLSGILGNDQFAQATGKYVQEAVHLHRMFTESMAQYLSALNLPSRTDIIALSDRVGELEDNVAGLQVEVRHLRRVLAEHEGGAADDAPIRPKRTKKPKESAQED